MSTVLYPTAATTATTYTSSLAPYAGEFDSSAAWHLMRRATFGPRREEVLDVQSGGLQAALEVLLEGRPALAPPLNADESRDPNVPIGATWIRAPYIDGFDVNPYRSRSLQAWQIMSYYESGVTLQARMALFWQNHFACPRDADGRFYYRYLNLLWDNALGNFRDLVKAMAVEGQMLFFLNGNVNTKESPNENFARELLELFTLGKGPQVGAGDYTNYTEEDIRAFSYALTGWRTRNNNSRDVTRQPTVEFVPENHDARDQQMSARFGNAVLAGTEGSAHEAIVDLIFAQPAAADYICRKLYRWFVYYDITAEVEANVIQPLAAVLRDNDFEVRPVLRALLGSEHFYEAKFRGAVIKSPVEHAIDLTRGLYLDIPTDVPTRYQFFRRLNWPVKDQQMELWTPPSVAGWKAWYQAPQYNRNWINAASLKIRTNLSNKITGSGWTFGDAPIVSDLLDYVTRFDDALNPNSLIAEFVERLLPRPATQDQIDAFKGILIPGLPDFEWTVEYQKHLDDPANENTAKSVRNKLIRVVRAIASTAEIHLS